MTFAAHRWRKSLVAAAFLLVSASSALALQVREDSGRFAALAKTAPGAPGVAATPLSSLSSEHASRKGWERFRAAHGSAWAVHLDRRSGAPLLVEGRGIPWTSGQTTGVEGLGASLRPFIAANRSLLLADDAELVLDRDASGELNPDVWQISFKRVVAGIPVEGQRYLFTIGHGNLMSFGAPRWSRIDADPTPDIDGSEAFDVLLAYMHVTAREALSVVAPPELRFVAKSAADAPAGKQHGPFAGPVGSGYSSALVWRLAVRVADDPGTWVATIDAHTGVVRSFEDETKYARVKGGVYPLSNDQNCPDGCEQAGYPMPFANLTINASSQTATTLGTFNCTPSAATATTSLAGPYVKVVDVCGPVSQSVTCNADIDLSSSPGTDCAVPAGASAGNTHAARSSFYHLNRIAEHARIWLPTRAWLTNQLTDTVNINSTCNAFWDGNGVNFFKSGGNCRNTGELVGVFLHEWGHGLDQNDGGGFDNPSEAYADVTAFMSTHVSCLGRGFRQFGNCGGYGNQCLTCNGVRDLDWDQRVNHVPSTPAGFVATYCSGGGGPCGREEHCEGYVAAEALWDLAARDLPASGMDQASAWQLADKLWYKSRLFSGGNAYNCSLPSSDGCGATTWYSKLRVVDDDDGNLANGTPHAAAIFAAFNRHAIACGAASDPANQDSGTCPAVGASTLSGTAGSSSAALSWTPVANAIGYRIMRTDAGCQAATNRLTLTGSGASTFTDTALVNGLPLYYSVQAIAANSACDGPLSNCVEVTPQSAAGALALDAASYPCTGQVSATVVDSNVAGSTVTVSFTSPTETVAEAVALARVAPGSATFFGTITLTALPPAADGKLSVADGNTFTARYIDANDGAGHVNQQRVRTALADCPAAGVGAKPVADGTFGTAMTGFRLDPSGSAIALTWDVTTCVSADHHVVYGHLADVASATVEGGACDLGSSGSATWSGVPAENLWFVVVGDDDAATEASWGKDGSGTERGGFAASGVCGANSRDNGAVCP